MSMLIWVWVRFQLDEADPSKGQGEIRLEVAQRDRSITDADLTNACHEVLGSMDNRGISAEQRAIALGNALLTRFGPRRLEITMSEDGQSGVTVAIDGRRPQHPPR